MMKPKRLSFHRIFRLSSLNSEEIIEAANTVAESDGYDDKNQISKTPCHPIISMLNVTIESALIIDASGVVRYANLRAISLFGWEQSDTVNGMQSSSFFDFVRGDAVESWKAATKGGSEANEQDAVGYKKNGNKFTVKVQLVELSGCGLSFGSENGDQTNETVFCAYIRPDDKIAELNKEILRLNRTEAAMHEAGSESVIIIDERGVIMSVDEDTLQQFGYKRDEIIGQNVNILMHDDHAPNHDSYIANYLRTGVKRVMGKRRQLIAKRKDGKIFSIQLGVAEIETNKGDTRMFVGMITNTSVTKGILDASFDSIFTITENGKILMVNQAAVRQFGWAHEEFIGQNINMICGGGHADKHNDYLKRYLETGEKRVMGKKRELIAKRKDGSEFFIELGLAEIATHEGGERRFCGFVHDITEQKEHNKILETKTNFYSGILESSYDSLFVINQYGIIQMVNEATVKNFGWSREEFIGKNVKMIVGGGHGTNHDEYIKQYLKTGVKKVMDTQRDLEALRKDGSTFPIKLGLAEIEGQDGTRMFAAFIKDVTDVKKVMDMEIEKAAAEVLLLNMLPEDIAVRLKDDPGHIADHHSDATILFADIVGFTAMSSKMSPKEVVSMLNILFSMFDELVEQYDLNKVKTIGDCYMVTSVPNDKVREDDCSRVCNFGLDMIAALHKYNESNPDHNLNLRVGINTGPVVAGVVGTKRFLYDLWGDAVNLASRMESSGIPGKIQVSKSVVDVTSDEFFFESRGLRQIKGKGEMETFLLVKRKKEKSPLPMRRSRTRKNRMSVTAMNVSRRLTFHESLEIMRSSVADSTLQKKLARIADEVADEVADDYD